MSCKLSSSLLVALPVAAFVVACSGGSGGDIFGQPGGDGGIALLPDGAPDPAALDGSTPGADGGEGDGGPGSCARVLATVKATPLIEFVVDDSGSMTVDNKKQSLIEALKASWQSLEGRAKVGMIFFNSSTNVLPSLLTAQHRISLDAALASWGDGGTPTLETMRRGYSVLDAFPSDPTKYLILLTDGQPNGGSNEEAQCISMAQQKAAPPTKTPLFSVGIGKVGSSGYNATFLGQLAQAGGTAPPGCDPAATVPAAMCHHQITPGDDPLVASNALVAALDSITGPSLCSFAIEKAAGASLDPAKTTVTFTDSAGNTTKIAAHPENGYSFDDAQNPTKLTLNGTSCNLLASDPKGKVDIALGCK